MANADQRKNFWLWLIVGLIAAALVVGTLLYIGWFDTRTHVDSNNGSDVLEQYQQDVQGADEPGVASWNNDADQSFIEEVTEPQPAPATPVSTEE